jgi:hypothetical protein
MRFCEAKTFFRKALSFLKKSTKRANILSHFADIVEDNYIYMKIKRI